MYSSTDYLFDYAGTWLRLFPVAAIVIFSSGQEMKLSRPLLLILCNCLLYTILIANDIFEIHLRMAIQPFIKMIVLNNSQPQVDQSLCHPP